MENDEFPLENWRGFNLQKPSKTIVFSMDFEGFWEGWQGLSHLAKWPESGVGSRVPDLLPTQLISDSHYKLLSRESGVDS